MPALALEDVGGIDACIPSSDRNLELTGLRIGAFLEADDLAAPRSGEDDGSHS
jgi:hypothetical protein